MAYEVKNESVWTDNIKITIDGIKCKIYSQALTHSFVSR